MTFQEAEKTYKDLRSQHSAGKVTDPDFEAQVNQLKVQDANGRWWQLGVRTGEWYYNDGQKWLKGKPPIAPAQPVAPSEDKPAPPVSAISAPPPTAPAESAPKEEKTERPSVMPRGLFAAKPEGSNGGGMSRPVLIGIIAVVAVVVIALLVGGFLFVQSFLGGGTARATTTPTQVAIVAPTSAPIVVATAIPVATNIPAVTATLVITVANTVEPAVRATATRGAVVARSATPTKAAAASATPAPPAGLYVTKIAIDRTIEANQPFAFRVTFFNNSSGPAHKDKWLILIYRKTDIQDGVPEKSIGDTATKILDVPLAPATDILSDAYRLGVEGQPKCVYLAEAYFIGDNNARVPITGTSGKRFQFEFQFCQ